MFRFTDQDEQVQNFLNTARIAYHVMFRGEVEKDEWLCDSFLVTFSSGKTKASFDYYTGIGHRVYPKNSRVPRLSFEAKASIKRHREALNAGTGKPFKLLDTVESSYLVVCPTAASVLYSLLLDASALEENFNSWAGNYGYSSDSIEALNIYKSCLEAGEKLHKIFNREQIEKLQLLLEGY